MPPPNNPNVAKVAMVFNHDTRTFVNTYHVSKGAPWSLPELQQLTAAFVDWWNTTGKLGVSAQTALRQVQARRLDPNLPLAHDDDVTPPIPGSQGGAPLPGNVTVTQSWRTGLAGRKYRGRAYVPGLTEPQVADDDRVVSATVVQLAAAALQLILDMVASSWSLAIFHKIDNTFTNVTSSIVENLVDSMRRRLPGRGR